MTALAEIQIDTSIAKVWDALIDAGSHPHWLGPGDITHYENDFGEGCRFRSTSVRDGITREGEIVSLKAHQYLKMRATLSPDHTEMSEYHLFEVDGHCRVRIVCEVFDTGESHHNYLVEDVEKYLEQTLERFRIYCEVA